MSDPDYDLFVIGAGSGGVRAARLAAANHGAKVAIAEEHRVGGTCVVRGCIPKKFLVYASEFGHGFDHARSYGWDADNVRFDWARLIANKDAEIDRLSGIYWRNLENAGVEVIEDRAVLESSNTVRLVQQDRAVTADKILIATGSAPFRPADLEGVEHTITSNEAFHLEALPGHVLVAGGGYIACEFAGIFNGLGAETCLVYRKDTVLRGFDMDVRTVVHAELKRQGVRVVTHAVIERVERTSAGLVAHLSNATKIECDCVMLAVGRTPNTHGLGLEAAGVEVTQSAAVKVDAFSRTNASNIFAIGDVTDRVPLTPVAIREAQAFVQTAFTDEPAAFDHATIASAVFTQPPVGSVGLTEAQARAEYGEVDIYKTDFRALKHTLTGDEERVLMKLVVRRDDGVVVGCHMVGPDAGEIIQLAAIAVKAGLTKRAWDETCAVHPTIAEEFVTLREAYVDPELRSAR